MRERYITWHDLAEQFGCGRNKALRIMHMLEPTYVGRTPYTTEQKLEQYLADHNNEIKIDWCY